MPPGLAQEELQRVGRRLGRRDGGRGWGSCLLLLLGRLLGDELDPAPVELHVHRIELERVELQRLEDLLELRLANLAARLAGLEQRGEVLRSEDRLDLNRRQISAPLRRPQCSWPTVFRARATAKHAGPLKSK